MALDPESAFRRTGGGLTATRKNTEQCWVATRGRPKRLDASVRELIIAPRRLHSQKPDEARKRIERMFAGPYLEMFARESHAGWDSWGDQAGLFDKGPVKTRRWSSDRTGKHPPAPR